MNRVYQLEYNGPTARLTASSHTPSPRNRTFVLDNENHDIQGLGRVAEHLNRNGEEIVSVMAEGYGRTKHDRRYVIITRVSAEAAKPDVSIPLSREAFLDSIPGEF